MLTKVTHYTVVSLIFDSLLLGLLPTNVLCGSYINIYKCNERYTVAP